jgi:hypothetical protein
MAAITTATEETLKSTTAEARLLEIFTYLQQAESDKVKNPNLIDYVQGSFNANTLTFTGSFNLPIGQVIDASGNIVISATTYLNDSTFNPGTDGTFKATNPSQYLIEIVTFLQNRELDTTKNPQGKNLVTGSLSTDENIYSGSVSLPLTMAINIDGSVSFTAQEYLS